MIFFKYQETHDRNTPTKPRKSCPNSPITNDYSIFTGSWAKKKRLFKRDAFSSSTTLPGFLPDGMLSPRIHYWIFNDFAQSDFLLKC